MSTSGEFEANAHTENRTGNRILCQSGVFGAWDRNAFVNAIGKVLPSCGALRAMRTVYRGLFDAEFVAFWGANV